MESYQSTFALFAELSLGLAGFAGVAAAFGGRQRSHGPGDENRLFGLFVSAGVTLAGCMAILTLIATDMSPHHIFLLVSAVLFAINGVVMLMRVPNNYRLAHASDASIEPWAAHLASFHFSALLLLYGGNLWLGGRAWPLIAGFSLQLLFGLWLFTRLLTRSN